MEVYQCRLSVLYTSLFITSHYFFMPLVCVLYYILKKKFPVWNDFQFCSTARQADKSKTRMTTLWSQPATKSGDRPIKSDKI